MEEFSQIINYVAYLLPAIVVGIVAYYFFKGHTANEEGRRRYLVQKEAQNKVLPMRLQAYERLTLLLERIDPNKLLIRIKPFSDEISKYEELLITNIEQEFEHNLAQQIYVSDQCWSIILAAKNATIQLIRKAAMNEKTDTADKLREVVLTELMERSAPSNAALSFIKEEVSSLW